MTTQQFPYKAWVLSPSYVPKEVRVEGHFYEGHSWRKAEAALNNGSYITLTGIFPTKADAIAAGLAKLEAAEARLAKQAETLRKRRENLEKQK